MRKAIKIIVLEVFLLVILALISRVEAADANISAGSTSVKVGEKVNVTVSINAAAWDIHISGAVSGEYADVSSDTKNVSITKKLSFTPNKEGTYPVYLDGNVTDENSTDGKSKKLNKSITITATKGTVSNNNNENNNSPNTEKEPKFKSSNETVYATGDINVRESYSTSSEAIGQLKSGQSVTRTGVGDNGWSKVTYNGKTGYIKSSLLTTEEPKKSSDKTLKILEIKPEGLDPEFNPETTNYTLNVGMDVEKLEITATPNDEKSKVEITGNDSLQVGDNMVKITVTAEDGTTRIYNIDVKKEEALDLGLTSIKINGYQLSPSFSSTVYEYKLNIMDPKINKLDITALANDENATVDISGNTSLKDGENTIIITVTSEDGKEKVVYQIYVNRAIAPTDSNNNKLMYLVIGVIAIIIIVIIILVIKKKKKKNNDLDSDKLDSYEDLYGYSSRGQNNTNREFDDENIDNQYETNPNNTDEFRSFRNESINNNIDNSYKNIDNTDINLNNEENEYDASNIQKAEENYKYNPYANQNIYGDYSEDKANNNSEMNSLYKENFSNKSENTSEQNSMIENNKYTNYDEYISDDDYKARKKGKHSK